ncbi:hypothetical protein ACKAV7_003753 [Fusarium commune]
MPPFHCLVRFQSADDDLIYFADLGVNGLEQLGVVSQVDGYTSVEGLVARDGGRPVRLGKILAPVPRTGVPIYCVGLNYQSHAEEAKLPEQCGRQFYFAKAFDKFPPIGPTLVHPEVIGQGEGLKLITRLNGDTVQEAEFMKDLIWKPAEILSWMSQGTTIPAGTAVMTGTPAGVGAFKNPRRLLTDSDVVEVEIPNVGVLRNKIVFE